MNLNIDGHHLDITPAIREYVTNKLTRIRRHVDHVIDAHVILTVEPAQHKADITLHLPGKDIHCAVADNDLYAAIDLLIDKADRQVVQFKEKQKNHAHAPIKRQEVA